MADPNRSDIKVAESLSDLTWFERVVEKAELYLSTVPVEQLSSWYLDQYAPERISADVVTEKES